jgi:glycosyltransferase involved in cell wall biosynthesis
MPANPIRIVLLITGLNTGGAEMMMLKLLSGIDRRRFTPVLISLSDHGTLGESVVRLGIPLYVLRMSPRRPPFLALFRLCRILRSIRPHIVQGWMYHANLMASVGRFLAARQAVVLWSVRQSIYDLEGEKKLTANTIRIGALLSKHVAGIIYNAEISARQHEALGYAADRSWVIPNGFDCGRFSPSAEARATLRRELGLADDSIMIGLIARYHPMKDHANFLRAAALMVARRDVHFVLAGCDVDAGNAEISDTIRRFNLENHIHLLGERHDMPSLTAALDIATSSSSWGEGFPNSIGEAMACAVPCVVTDIGDSARIVGSCGRAIAPRDPAALANAWDELLDLPSDERRELGQAARRRVLDRYSIDAVVRQYEDLYARISQSSGAG